MSLAKHFVLVLIEFGKLERDKDQILPFQNQVIIAIGQQEQIGQQQITGTPTRGLNHNFAKFAFCNISRGITCRVGNWQLPYYLEIVTSSSYFCTISYCAKAFFFKNQKIIQSTRQLLPSKSQKISVCFLVELINLNGDVLMMILLPL